MKPLTDWTWHMYAALVSIMKDTGEDFFQAVESIMAYCAERGVFLESPYFKE